MFNNIKRVAAVIALTGWMGVANASLIFDFSYGTTGNELVGEITGLVDEVDGQVQSAVSIRFTTATGSYAAFPILEYDIRIDHNYNQANNFIVIKRQITFAMLRIDTIYNKEKNSKDSTYIIHMVHDGTLRLFKNNRSNLLFNANPASFNGFVNRVAPSPAPEPSAVFLLALGLAGVSFSRYKKKS
jgi:hypothetical protein